MAFAALVRICAGSAFSAFLPDAGCPGGWTRDHDSRGDRLQAQNALHPLQEAFRDNHALQCGFCTPGMLTTLIEFLADNPNPTEQQVRAAISGNLCRCTGYQNIVSAVLDAARRMTTGGVEIASEKIGR